MTTSQSEVCPSVKPDSVLIASGRLMGMARWLCAWIDTYGSIQELPESVKNQVCRDVVRYAAELEGR